MPTTRQNKSGARTRAKTATVEPVRIGKRQGWRVTSGGEAKTVVTSATSAAAIEEATAIYGRALKRLAKR